MRANAAKCGTTSGYAAHKRRGETPCTPCGNAIRAYDRARYVPHPLPPAECGTHGGRRAHYRRGEPQCPECREFWREYQREWYRKRRGVAS